MAGLSLTGRRSALAGAHFSALHCAVIPHNCRLSTPLAVGDQGSQLWPSCGSAGCRQVRQALSLR